MIWQFDNIDKFWSLDRQHRWSPNDIPFVSKGKQHWNLNFSKFVWNTFVQYSLAEPETSTIKSRLNGCTEHVGTTSSNIVGHNMLSSFKHHVGISWAVLDRVGRCWMKFDFCQTFHSTSANMFLRACAFVDIYRYPISPRSSKRGHYDPRRHSVRIENRHFAWSQKFVSSIVFTGKHFIFDCRPGYIFYQRMWLSVP